MINQSISFKKHLIKRKKNFYLSLYHKEKMLLDKHKYSCVQQIYLKIKHKQIYIKCNYVHKKCSIVFFIQKYTIQTLGDGSKQRIARPFRRKKGMQ